jgi:adenine-specific DNA-methyltransferase
MDNKKKHTGSYYTPKLIAEFLVDYLSTKLSNKSNISILEPSVGDGIFIHSIFNHNKLFSKVKKVIAIEKDESELNKICYTEPKFIGIHSDFLKYQKNDRSKYNLVIGNPPYIKKGLLEEEQIDLCKEIHFNAALSDIQPKNIWTAFLVRCINYLDNSGILAFVLPSELLQVKFAAELRELILKEFERVEIFTFNELLFKECQGQDTILLIGEKKSINKGVYYCNIDKITDLANSKFSLAQNVKIKESKWTHHHLATDEIELLEKLKQQLQKVNNYCISKAGIVTAANDFFIVDTNTVENFSLHKFVKPIIQKGVFVNGSVDLTYEDFQVLIDELKPTYLITLDKNTPISKNSKIWNYLKRGKEKEIDKRYKTSQRKIWYEVPNIGMAPEAFFFKRCNEYPKLIKNSAHVLSTDSAYTITMRENYKIENFIYSFYNSLTLAFAELHGRYYGGGVLELTPNEFKNLPIPYTDLRLIDFNTFKNNFKNKNSIKDICKKNDITILKSIDNTIDSESIQKLFKIREKLYLRRIKTN